MTMKAKPDATTSLRSSAATARLIEEFRKLRIIHCQADTNRHTELTMLPTATSDQLLQQALAMSILQLRELNTANSHAAIALARKEKSAND
jgi:hypothetical protein